jgi:four helix bundle protein
MSAFDYTKLPTWRAAMGIVPVAYSLTRGFPDDERSGLTATIRRTAVAIPTAIANANARPDPKAMIDALEGSLSTMLELENGAYSARRLGYIGGWRLRRLRRKLARLHRLFEAEARRLRMRIEPADEAAAADEESAEPLRRAA